MPSETLAANTPVVGFYVSVMRLLIIHLSSSPYWKIFTFLHCNIRLRLFLTGLLITRMVFQLYSLVNERLLSNKPLNNISSLLFTFNPWHTHFLDVCDIVSTVFAFIND